MVFDESKSDLSGLSSKSSYVTKIIQKVFMKVDETGAEAAAATSNTKNKCLKLLLVLFKSNFI